MSMLSNDVPVFHFNEEDLYRLISENMHDMVCLHQLNGDYLYVSPSVIDLLGYTSGELIGTSPYVLFKTEETEKIHSEVHQPLFSGVGNTYIKYQIRKKDGTYVWFETFTKTITNAAGQPVKLQTVSRDITRRIQVEQEIFKLKDLLTGILDSSLSGVMAFQSIRNEQGIIEDFEWLLINKEAESIVGIELNLDQLIGKRIFAQIPHYRQRMYSKFVQVVETGISIKHIEPYESEGYKRWFQIIIVKLNDGFVATFSDITEIKKNEQSLLQTSILQKALLNSDNHIIISTDIYGLIQTFNIGAEKLLGYTATEVTSIFFLTISPESSTLSLQKVTHEQSAMPLQPHFEEITKQLTDNDTKEVYYVGKNGNRFPVSFSICPLNDGQGNSIGYMMIASDISEQKKAQAALKWKETLLRKMTESAPLAFYIIDQHSDEIMYFNHRFCEMWNVEHLEDMMRNGELKNNELCSHINSFLKYPDNFESIHKKIQWTEDNAIHEEEIELITRRTIKILATQIRDDANAYGGSLYIYEDITQRKISDKKLKTTHGSLVEAQKIAHIGNWEFDLHTQEITWSDELFNIYGLPVSGNAPTFSEMLKRVHPEDIDMFMEVVETCIQKGISYDINHRVILPDESIRYVHCIGHPVMAADKSIIAIKGISHEVTQQKLIEEQLVKAKEMAEHSVKLKEQFLANMSHEIRTPLNGIVGMAHLLSKTSLDTEQKQFMEAIKFSADNLMVIINDILDLAKIEAGKMHIEETRLYIRQIVNNVAHMFSIKTAEKNIELLIDIDESIPATLLGDPVRLNQILLNLIGNAVKFTKGGAVHVKVEIEKESSDSMFLQFTVSDSGIGIAKENLDYIFEIFTQATHETTRKFGGTGLGLPICKKLIELQKGKIKVVSQLGKGSDFIFTLPYQKEIFKADTTIQTVVPEIGDLPESMHILLAEDNEINRLIVLTMLKRWKQIKMQVDVAVNGREVLDMVQKHHYDLILMDCQMPDIDGYSATRIIRNEIEYPKCKVPIIAVTASALQQDKERVFDAGMDDFIAKPFEQAELFDKILLVAQRKKQNETQIQSGLVKEKEEMEEKLFDLTFLKSIAGEDPTELHDIIEKFIENLPLDVAQMEIALINKDYKPLAACAHKLKANLKFFGIERLYSVIELLEKVGQTETEYIDVNALLYHIAIIKDTTEKVISGLKYELKEKA